MCCRIKIRWGDVPWLVGGRRRRSRQLFFSVNEIFWEQLCSCYAKFNSNCPSSCLLEKLCIFSPNTHCKASTSFTVFWRTLHSLQFNKIDASCVATPSCHLFRWSETFRAACLQYLWLYFLCAEPIILPRDSMLFHLLWCNGKLLMYRENISNCVYTHKPHVRAA